MQCNITIRKKDKGFQCIVSYKDGNRWRQKSKQGFETQKAAKIHAQTIIDELKKTITFSIDDSLKDLTLMQFFNIYLNEQLNLTANTLIAYKNALNVVDALKNKKITEITTLDITREFNNTSYSISSINLCTAVLKLLFNYAISPYAIIHTNPCMRLKTLKKKDNKKLSVFTESELSLLENMQDKHYMYYVLFSVARYTGARYGEIIGINWSDIDLVNQTMTINKQWTALINGKYGYANTKSTNGVRTIPIPPVLTDILSNFKKISSKERLFDFKNNKSTLANQVLKQYIQNKTMHSFRHTYACTLLANNVDIKTVASLLGDTVDTVINNYIHYTDEMRKNAADKVANIFG
jgi:integrase